MLYAKVKNAEQMKAERKRQEHLGASTHLLSTPISMLLHEIRYEKVTSDLAAKESKRLRPNPGETASAKPQKLWVDKYAPSQFIDLLSDQVNFLSFFVSLSLHSWNVNSTTFFPPSANQPTCLEMDQILG